ncbi:hypothetical protein HanXRQr2_Chr11g0513791 [Helianthus annuus]|uniref:Uncharacterized protein n=1 Tax=Helianthus annuus TaxID=4232 RepID=A0A9K3N1T7_HELAN|nr:hypothetical protein HanXRQr2_Chr11g0513791 [Helianthus annuus]
MFRQFTRQHKPNRRLNLTRSNRRLLVVSREPRRLLREFFEYIVDETVHDPHSFA